MTRSPSSAVLPGLVVLLFAGWTVFNLVAPKATFTIGIYNDYASRARSTSLRAMYDEKWVEYPPLAVGLLLATRHVTDALEPVLRPTASPEKHPAAADLRRFGRTFGVFGCAVQVLVFWGLFRLCRRLFPEESPAEFSRRLFVYVAGSLLMTDLVYQRLDAVLAALVFLSVALLGTGRWVASFAVLAAAIAFKLVPVALVPLWLFASLPGDVRARWRPGRGLRVLATAVAGRGALLAAFVAAWVLPFSLAGGPRCFAFLDYHRARGVHCESTYGAVLMLLRWCGYAFETQFRFGCWELHSPLAARLGVASTPLLAGGLLAAALLGFVNLGPDVPGDRPGRTAPDLGRLVALTVLTLMAFAGLGKVFSPQYALWVIPLVPLVPLRGRSRDWFFGLFLLACLLTRLAHPAFRQILNGRGALLPTVVLTTRALLWFGLIGWLAVLTFRPGHRPDPS